MDLDRVGSFLGWTRLERLGCKWTPNVPLRFSRRNGAISGPIHMGVVWWSKSCCTDHALVSQHHDATICYRGTHGWCPLTASRHRTLSGAVLYLLTAQRTAQVPIVATRLGSGGCGIQDRDGAAPDATCEDAAGWTRRMQDAS